MLMWCGNPLCFKQITNFLFAKRRNEKKTKDAGRRRGTGADTVYMSTVSNYSKDVDTTDVKGPGSDPFLAPSQPGQVPVSIPLTPVPLPVLAPVEVSGKDSKKKDQRAKEPYAGLRLVELKPKPGWLSGRLTIEKSQPDRAKREGVSKNRTGTGKLTCAPKNFEILDNSLKKQVK